MEMDAETCIYSKEQSIKSDYLDHRAHTAELADHVINRSKIRATVVDNGQNRTRTYYYSCNHQSLVLDSASCYLMIIVYTVEAIDGDLSRG